MNLSKLFVKTSIESIIDIFTNFLVSTVAKLFGDSFKSRRPDASINNRQNETHQNPSNEMHHIENSVVCHNIVGLCIES